MDHNTSFLVAAVPLPLCPWVQEMCYSGSGGSSGCHRLGVVVYLSVLPWLPSSLQQELVQLLCQGALSHWCIRASRTLERNHPQMTLNYMLFGSIVYHEWFGRTCYHRAPVASGCCCNMYATIWHIWRWELSLLKDRFFCFGEEMSPKGSLLDVSLLFRLHRVVSQ